jgi:hypothetical protein
VILIVDKEIALTRGLHTIIDECDYEELSKYKWNALFSRGSFYAARWGKNAEGKRRHIFMHSVILNGVKMTDHINGCTLDNRRENLRECTPSQNQANKHKLIAFTSIYKGVAFYKPYGCWRAQICKDRKVMHIGYFASEAEAARKYDEKAKELFGEYACLNDVPEEVW